ncbi:Receptor-type guanylate cyclase gcy [Seminavis robusta]|uniref:Receptor-type guanylate cyclase gcy n=1 Tax=Seminavis robusta TaxID=568900 RepID=A0A9N8DQQ4_9STRA|nr:Receptor-type guanylate cyclase gcy [Seminavis robusta]|eukprot:Sro218_g090190.1 Receptor-type guanylate cyclase gcy (880) ;mRNA; f:72020-74853
MTRSPLAASQMHHHNNQSHDTEEEDEANFDDEDLESLVHSNIDTSAHQQDDDNVVGTKNLQKEERETLARRESQAVGCIRIVVYLVVLMVAISVSLVVYFYTKSDQQQDFETQFAAFAAKVAESFYDSVERKMGAIATFSTTITSYAVNTGATFPNITVPDFELRGAHTRIQAAGVILYFFPLVRDQDRAGWEEYAANNRMWIRSAFLKESKWKGAQDAKFGLGKFEQTTSTTQSNQQEQQDNNNRNRRLQEQEQLENATVPPELQLQPLEMEGGYSYHIFETGRTPSAIGSGPFLPIWQISPVLPIVKYLNYDMLNHTAVQDSLHAAVDSEKLVMGHAHDVRDPSHKEDASTALYNAFLQVGQYRHDVQKYEGDPATNIVYPVFTNFGPNKTLGGVINTSLYWRLNFLAILPDTAKGIMCVITNTRGQVFTYRVDGPNVTFLGPGDRHDPKYDSMVVSEDVTEKLLTRASPENQGFDAAELDTEYCRYYLHVYPSEDTEAEYVNNEPVLYTVLVASVFLFTSLVFILYDWLVARRQRIVMDRAVQSSAIVSSLYPKQVRDRLFKDDKSHASNSHSDAWKAGEGKEADVNGLLEYDEKKSKSLDRPIADTYEACTVLFADLAGFTKFSASRKPEDVFYLLETLYQAFDKIATRRKVFKVETIGDCYVACTGLPEAQPNHAVIMVKFARDCYSKMSFLLPMLAEKLGPEAATLSFRVGLHSGPVTGGVLRGQKSRFQLFGDTINTASRMESLGIAGRIHMSQTTADELISKGFGRWVVPREDKVQAKGKGEMQTYFANILDNARSMKSTDMSVLSSSMSIRNFLSDDLPRMGGMEQNRDGSNLNGNGSSAPTAYSSSPADVLLGETDDAAKKAIATEIEI